MVDSTRNITTQTQVPNLTHQISDQRHLFASSQLLTITITFRTNQKINARGN